MTHILSRFLCSNTTNFHDFDTSLGQTKSIRNVVGGSHWMTLPGFLCFRDFADKSVEFGVFGGGDAGKMARFLGGSEWVVIFEFGGGRYTVRKLLV